METKDRKSRLQASLSSVAALGRVPGQGPRMNDHSQGPERFGRGADLQQYAKIPPAVSDAYIRAANRLTEPEARARRRFSPGLVIALCLLLLAATALAAVHRLSIIHLFGVGSIDPQEAKTAIQTEIMQSGGETSLGSFRVTEAFYDGVFLRFIVEGDFAEETVLIDEPWMMWPDSESIADLPGKRVGVRASAVCEGLSQLVHVYPPYERGGTWLVAQNFFYRFADQGEQAETLNITLSIDLLEIDDGAIIDSTVLTFTIARTVEAKTIEHEVQVQTDFVAVERISLARTPLETYASVEFRPLLRAFSGFTIVPDDGYVIRDGRAYFFGGHYNTPILEDGKGRMEYVLPQEHARGDRLTLWVSGTDEAIVIDLHTGEASVRKVVSHREGEDHKIEIMEE